MQIQIVCGFLIGFNELNKIHQKNLISNCRYPVFFKINYKTFKFFEIPVEFSVKIEFKDKLNVLELNTEEIFSKFEEVDC